MPNMKPKAKSYSSAAGMKAKKVSKPVPLGGVKKRKAPSEDQLWGAAKPVRKKQKTKQQSASSRAKEATRAKNKVMAERRARTHGNANTPGFAYGRKTQ